MGCFANFFGGDLDRFAFAITDIPTISSAILDPIIAFTLQLYFAAPKRLIFASHD